jgi:hypothetical protein
MYEIRIDLKVCLSYMDRGIVYYWENIFLYILLLILKAVYNAFYASLGHPSKISL